MDTNWEDVWDKRIERQIDTSDLTKYENVEDFLKSQLAQGHTLNKHFVNTRDTFLKQMDKKQPKQYVKLQNYFEVKEKASNLASNGDLRGLVNLRTYADKDNEIRQNYAYNVARTRIRELVARKDISSLENLKSDINDLRDRSELNSRIDLELSRLRR